ncbi:MAG TPA: CtsR family transcriptional regulator [Bacillota bacterium]|nr:CtsR family transcriptional regulator [Bacillota bacterium]
MKGIGNLSDLIEQYLQKLLIQSNRVELQRRELARMFRCVPSQINYVLETRFRPEFGYLVESRRGGGGFIRIYRLERELPSHAEVSVPESVTQEQAEELLERLIVGRMLQEEQALMVRLALARNLSGLPREIEDIIRAKMLRAVLLMLEGMDN